MEWILFEKLSELTTAEWLLLAFAAALTVGLIFFAVIRSRKAEQAHGAAAQLNAPATKTHTEIQALVFGALCISMSFVLSYVKLFSMPLGGSMTLCSMLPLGIYAYSFGAKRGFIAAFAYGVLQFIQGATVVHWVQVLLDYFLAFTCYGLAAFFKKSLPLGIFVAGAARLLVSTVSGVVFFGEYAAYAGYNSALVYSLFYNGATIGAETLLSTAILFIPAFKKAIKRISVK